MNILLITPPLTQLNTPYPATAYLKGFLKKNGILANQADLGIELVLTIFSKKGLTKMFDKIESYVVENQAQLEDSFLRMLKLRKNYEQVIEPVIRFLQHEDATLANRICQGGYLPEGGRFQHLEDMDWAFGSLGTMDRARHLCTLFIEDLGDLLRETIAPHFDFTRYAEKLAMSATSFTRLEEGLKTPNNFTDEILVNLMEEKIQIYHPDLVGFTVPFPGNLYGALKCAQHIKKHHPHIKTVLGGGFANTELRSLKEPKVFDYVDFITLDDGEGCFLKLIEYLEGKRPKQQLQRTFALSEGKVHYFNACLDRDIPHKEIGTPDYSDLPLKKYLSVIDVPNPMHKLWSDGRWNKLTVAHGCYWKKCSFCDITLDYIRRYDVAPAKTLVDRVEEVIQQTGETGFHFVDEAAPPLGLRDLAIELLKRQTSISWWANIRFEKTFNKDLCRLLAASGCIAVSGGLEVASDRLLELMEKGVSIEQVSVVTQAFTEAGILVHAYLMYGFPTQTAQETVDSLEVVRQLFQHGLIHSGFWHRFTMTVHSPVGKNPEKYGVIRLSPEEGTFANNDLQHADPKGCNHDLFSEGLRKSLYNYMHGIGLDFPLQDFFEFKIPKTTHSKQLIASFLSQKEKLDIEKGSNRVLWIGNSPEIQFFKEEKKGKTIERAKLLFYEKREDFTLKTSKELAEWWMEIFPKIALESEEILTLNQLKESYLLKIGDDFQQFLESYFWKELRKRDLLLLHY
jgi:radical SAM superfamily enzyme YgiQ (UPF0313 family)